MRYVRIYEDAAGDSHFEDVEVATEFQSATGTRSASEVSSLLPASGVVFRRVVAEGSTSEPHTAPRRQFVVHLAGEAEVEVSDGEVRTFGPGSVVLVEDMNGKGHVTRQVGDTRRETLFIHLA